MAPVFLLPILALVQPVAAYDVSGSKLSHALATFEMPKKNFNYTAVDFTLDRMFSAVEAYDCDQFAKSFEPLIEPFLSYVSEILQIFKDGAAEDFPEMKFIFDLGFTMFETTAKIQVKNLVHQKSCKMMKFFSRKTWRKFIPRIKFLLFAMTRPEQCGKVREIARSVLKPTLKQVHRDAVVTAHVLLGQNNEMIKTMAISLIEQGIRKIGSTWSEMLDDNLCQVIYGHRYVAPDDDEDYHFSDSDRHEEYYETDASTNYKKWATEEFFDDLDGSDVDDSDADKEDRDGDDDGSYDYTKHAHSSHTQGTTRAPKEGRDYREEL